MILAVKPLFADPYLVRATPEASGVSDVARMSDPSHLPDKVGGYAELSRPISSRNSRSIAAFSSWGRQL